jgi:hypothetical protein
MTAPSDARTRLGLAGLERLAEERGDITAEALERYYVRMPEARRSFEYHGLDDVAGLEARMVSETVFLLLRWIEDRSATMIDQGSTIVHHNDALEIGPRWYMGLVDAVLEVLLETIPAGAEAERRLWSDVRGEIAVFVDSLRHEFVRIVDREPLAS